MEATSASGSPPSGSPTAAQVASALPTAAPRQQEATTTKPASPPPPPPSRAVASSPTTAQATSSLPTAELQSLMFSAEVPTLVVQLSDARLPQLSEKTAHFTAKDSTFAILCEVRYKQDTVRTRFPKKVAKGHVLILDEVRIPLSIVATPANVITIRLELNYDESPFAPRGHNKAEWLAECTVNIGAVHEGKLVKIQEWLRPMNVTAVLQGQCFVAGHPDSDAAAQKALAATSPGRRQKHILGVSNELASPLGGDVDALGRPVDGRPSSASASPSSPSIRRRQQQMVSTSTQSDETRVPPPKSKFSMKEIKDMHNFEAGRPSGRLAGDEPIKSPWERSAKPWRVDPNSPLATTDQHHSNHPSRHNGRPEASVLTMEAMKRLTAAWPSDDVEGLLVFCEELKRQKEDALRSVADLTLKDAKRAAESLQFSATDLSQLTTGQLQNYRSMSSGEGGAGSIGSPLLSTRRAASSRGRTGATSLEEDPRPELERFSSRVEAIHGPLSVADKECLELYYNAL